MAELGAKLADEGPGEVIRTAARAYERDRYLSALLSPRKRRAHLIALAAFAGEIGRIPVYVNEPMAGEIRFQWWREVLGLSDQRRETGGHPIAEAVRAATFECNLPRALFSGFIDAHAARLWDEPVADDHDLTTQLAKTDGALFALAWRILGGPEQEPEPLALTEAGQAYGLARLVAEVPLLLAERRTLLPSQRLAEAGVDLGALAAGDGLDRLSLILADLRSEARRRLVQLRAELRSGTLATRCAVLPVALVEPYLRASEGALDGRALIDIGPLTRTWCLWRARRLGRY
jgi:phytoene synthase